MRIITQNDQRLEWISWTWIQLFAAGALAVVPLFFGLIAVVEGEFVAALLPVAVSLLGITLFAFFAGKRRVTFDKGTGEITVEFRSLLRHRIE